MLGMSLRWSPPLRRVLGRRLAQTPSRYSRFPSALHERSPGDIALTSQLSRQPLCRFSSSATTSLLTSDVAAASVDFQVNSTEPHDSDETVPPAPQPQSSEFAGLPLSDDLKAKLRERNIETLFPVQEQCFSPVIENRDLIVRSRTGTGKTLAFALPVVSKLQRDFKAGRGRSPRGIVMAPTRELARQVKSEFEWLAPRLQSVCVYGGASYAQQEEALQRGVDVVVGTPGRLMDMVERGALDMSELEICVLDEADEMLQIGFAKEMDELLSQLPAKRQMLMFSATIPDWVKKVSSTHMTNPTTIDLVGNEKIKTSDTIKHVAMMVQPLARLQILGDVLTVHGGERAIVFVRTKKEADTVASSPLVRDESCVLHGDINQAGREIALAGFRSGRYRNLIATDVAARGIDIPDVDLVVQYTMPERGSVETYIHRSGRTGRAGRSGTSIVFYTERDKTMLGMVEKAIGVAIDRSSPPHLDVVLESAAKRVRQRLQKTPQELVDQFLSQADFYLKEVAENGGTATQAMASALAQIAGYDAAVSERSILTYKEGYTALSLEPKVGVTPRELYLRRSLVHTIVMRSLNHVDEVPKIGRIVTHQDGAVVDLPSKFATELVKVGLKHRDYDVRELTTLPSSALDAMLDTDSGRRDRDNTGYGRRDRESMDYGRRSARPQSRWGRRDGFDDDFDRRSFDRSFERGYSETRQGRGRDRGSSSGRYHSYSRHHGDGGRDRRR